MTRAATDDQNTAMQLDGSSTTALTIAPSTSAELAALVERTRATISDAVPLNTRRAYASDLRLFAAWCTELGLLVMPAALETVVLYMRALADRGRRYSTIERALAAVCTAHVRAGCDSPWTASLVADMRAALRNELGVRPAKKRAADDEVLRRMLALVPTTGLLGLRDRALLCVGWCMAARRSELVALDVADIIPAPKGAVVLVRKSKTDQARAGAEVPLFYSNAADCCPVRTVEMWLTTAGITEGPIFRQLGRQQRLGDRLSPPAVLDRVRHYAKLAGLAYNDYGAHSLRSGFITTAARRGKDLDSIMVTTRHRSERVARAYIERANPHERGAGEGLL